MAYGASESLPQRGDYLRDGASLARFGKIGSAIVGTVGVVGELANAVVDVVHSESAFGHLAQAGEVGVATAIGYVVFYQLEKYMGRKANEISD